MSDARGRGDQAQQITALVSGGPGIIPPGEDVPGLDSLVRVGEAPLPLTASYSRILVNIAIRNGSNQKISDVRATLVTYPDGSDWGTAEMRWPEIGPGLEEMTALYEDTGVRGAGQVRLEFTDAMGLRWALLGGDLHRYLKPKSESVSVAGEMPLAVRIQHTP